MDYDSAIVALIEGKTITHSHLGTGGYIRPSAPLLVAHAGDVTPDWEPQVVRENTMRFAMQYEVCRVVGGTHTNESHRFACDYRSDEGPLKEEGHYMRRYIRMQGSDIQYKTGLGGYVLGIHRGGWEIEAPR